ncbi:class II aldolase/adducin family protein [Enterocloster sp.]|uniref:class II aldolase/adducin family protein n=1 Tax=Enterocloster sp. TaxID=2719315 RepID=UPI0039A3C6B7
MRAGENLFLVTPSGMIYEEMTADDVVVIEQGLQGGGGGRKAVFGFSGPGLYV